MVFCHCEPWFLQFMTTFHNLLLKEKPVELQGWLSPFWKLEMSLMYVYVSMHGLLYLRKRNYLETQKSVIFGLQPCHFDHKTCRGSLNFILMTMAHALSQNTEINYSFSMEIRSVSSKPFALLKNQTPQITRLF